jgi:hypothetical protein
MNGRNIGHVFEMLNVKPVSLQILCNLHMPLRR